MNAIERSVVLTIVLLIAGSTVAVGPVLADSATCENESSVVGVTQNGVVEKSVALYPGTEIQLATCRNGSTQGFDASRLDTHDGYEVIENGGTETPTIRITGAAYPINFSSLLDSTMSKGLTVTEPEATYHSQILDRTVTFSSPEQMEDFQETEREYRDSVNATRNAATDLNDIVGDVDNSPHLSTETEDSANDVLERLSTAHESMNENASELRTAALDGQSDGAVLAVERALAENMTATAETGSAAITAYRQSVATHRAGARSTILTYLGGPLLGGLLVGAILGAAVPLKQARNVEEQLRLSRNVEYSPRVALIPILVGVVFVIGGLIVLWYIDGLSLVGILL